MQPRISLDRQWDNLLRAVDLAIGEAEYAAEICDGTGIYPKAAFCTAASDLYDVLERLKNDRAGVEEFQRRQRRKRRALPAGV